MNVDEAWTLVRTDRGNQHVMPKEDLVLHEAAPDCVCMPSPVPVHDDGAIIGWVWNHHALDPLIERA